MEKAIYKARKKELRAEANRLKRKLRRLDAGIRAIKPLSFGEVLTSLLDTALEESRIKAFDFCQQCFKFRDGGGFNKRSKICIECAKENRLSYTRRYNSNPRNRVKRNQAMRVKLKNDPMLVMVKRIRGRIASFIRSKGLVKLMSTKEMLGCSYEQFMLHIESQFKDGMGWNNYNEWHIDHKKPLASAKNEIDLIKLNHYTNLRPMWAIDNLKKGTKYNGITY